MDLSNKASNLRKKLGADGESPIDIFKLVQKIENLTLVFYGLGKNISGVCYIRNSVQSHCSQFRHAIRKVKIFFSTWTVSSLL